MNMNVTCPPCELENAYVEIVDTEGAHYVCPDCDYKWCDPEYKSASDENEPRFTNIDPATAMAMANKLRKKDS